MQQGRRIRKADSEGRGHGIDVDLRCSRLQRPRPVVNLTAIDPMPRIRRVEAVALRQPVLKCPGSRAEDITRGPILRNELRSEIPVLAVLRLPAAPRAMRDTPAGVLNPISNCAQRHPG